MPLIPFCKTAGLSREEWLKHRLNGIGGSDAAAVVGLSPYSSAYKVYLDKTGKLPEAEQTESMRIGNDLEDYVAKRFCEETGKKVKRTNFMYRHPEHEFMLADFDRLIVGESAGLECKTTSAFAKSDFENGSVPNHYYVQCQHYMAVSGFDHWYLAVLVLGVGFYWFCIQRNEDDIQALIEAEKAFWYTNIVPKEPPAPDGSDSTTDALNSSYAYDSGTEIALYDQEETVASILALKAEEAERKKLIQQGENLIKSQMEDAATAYIPGYKATWKTSTRKTFDTKKFRQDYPELYEEYLREQTTRKFTLQPVKENNNE